MAGSWLPHTYDGLITWMINWVAKLNVHKTTLIIPTGDITSATNDLAALQFQQASSETFKTRTQEMNDYKSNLVYGPGPIGAFPVAPSLGLPPTTVAANIVARISALAAFCKAASAYTTSIGEDLGIEGPAAGPGPTHPEGTVATALANSQVQLDWVKSVFDGVVVECQRGSETSWTVLGQDFFSPFIDTRGPLVAGQPEQRRYRLRYLQGDAPVGTYSDIVAISTTP